MFTKDEKEILWNTSIKEVFKYSSAKVKVDEIFKTTKKFPRRPEPYDNIVIYKCHEWGRVPDGQDGIKLGNEFGYTEKLKPIVLPTPL